MSLYVGRLDLGGMAKVSRTRQRYAIDGDYQGASVAAAVQMRENLPWLEGTIQPVTWSEDSTLDGFYRIVSVQVEHNETTLSTGWFGWSMDLEPLPHHRALEVEATCRGTERTAAPAGVTGDYYYCVPSSATSLNYGHGSLTTDTRTGPGGTARVIGGAALSGRFVRWTSAPDDFYDMSPAVTFSGVTVVGLQSTRSPLTVALSNGLVKVEMVTGASTLQFTAPASTNANWGTPVAVDLGWWDGVSALTVMDPDAFTSARVLRETAEVCVVRWSWYSAGVVRHVDVSLRRGSPVAEIVISQESGYTAEKFGITQASCTTVHSSRTLRTTTYEGNYLITFSGDTTTQVAASGIQYLTTAADQYRCGIGVVIEGGSAPTINAEGSLRDFFFGAQMILERFSGVRS